MHREPPTEKLWSESEVEELTSCPLCGSGAVRKRITGLRDLTFFVAGGDWSMTECGGCSALYLNPRPKSDVIYKAYASYYTHEATESERDSSGQTTSLPMRLKSGIKNIYFKGRRKQFGFLSGAVCHAYGIVSPDSAVSNEYILRHLPPAGESGQRLLDVGCGNGEWLKTAAELGYSVFGIDPDDGAVRAARAAGLDVELGSLPGAAFPDDFFHQITLSHVLEHLHFPIEALKDLHRMLVPGGRVWISSPNANASGFAQFGAYWRGLEIPRHITVANSKHIVRILESAGFARVSLLKPRREAGFYYRQSVAIENGVDPYSRQAGQYWSDRWQGLAEAADAKSRADILSSESLTVVAFKP